MCYLHSACPAFCAFLVRGGTCTSFWDVAGAKSVRAHPFGMSQGQRAYAHILFGCMENDIGRQGVHHLRNSYVELDSQAYGRVQG